MEEIRREEAFIKDKKRALIGCVNGIILNDLFWPFLVIIMMQLILQDKYQSMVENNNYTINLILMIVTNLIILVTGIFIANPRNLINAYNKFEKSHIKTIILGVLAILGFNFVFNIYLLAAGIDPNGGNQNQTVILDLINNNAILSFVAMVILAPLLEELTYRYFLYGGVALYNRKLAIFISGFVFMCAHAVASFTSGVDNILREILLLPPYFFSGFVLAYTYDKKSSLLVPTSIHILNNLISFILSVI